jgi:hypothetical protein
MQSFPWRKFGKNYWNNPVASSLTVEFAGPEGAVSVEGIFDSGADSTELAQDLIQTLGIDLAKCAAMKAHGIWRPFTVVHARLDDHVFDLPVTFTPDVHADDETVNLFGRLGIFEHFRITHRPDTRQTEFEWVNGMTAPVVTQYDNWLVEWIAAHPGGFTDGVDYA